MVLLKYATGHEEITNWKERLERMVLKHQLVRQDELLEPQLQYGKDIRIGKVAIDAYLDGLEEFVKTWNEDRCDKYEF